MYDGMQYLCNLTHTQINHHGPPHPLSCRSLLKQYMFANHVPGQPCAGGVRPCADRVVWPSESEAPTQTWLDGETRRHHRKTIAD